MRILMLGGLLAAGLILGRASHAQTFASPFSIATNVQSYFDSCGLPQQELELNYGEFSIYAPTAVYRINQLRWGHLQLRPWSVTLAPLSGADMSLWVCLITPDGLLNHCVDASDNIGNGIPEQVTVPAVVGSYYVIATGNIGNFSPLCGNYLLTAFH